MNKIKSLEWLNRVKNLFSKKYKEHTLKASNNLTMEILMKKLLFLAFSLAVCMVEGTHFQSSMSVSPINNKNEYLIEMQIEKITNEQSSPELIASPKIICKPGEPAQLIVESVDKTNLLSVQATIPSTKESVQTSVLVKEKSQVVLSFNNVIKLNSEMIQD